MTQEDTYKTITELAEGIYTEKRSKFIAIAIPVRTLDEVKQHLEVYQKKYYDARHVCYAYMLGHERKNFRANDNGEPSGTAGKPALEVLTREGVRDVCLVVTRYFGGILLGAPGLVRAYSSAAKAALDAAALGRYCNVESMYCVCEYKDFDKLRYMLEGLGAEDISPEFAESVTVYFKCGTESSPLLRVKISEAFSKRLTAESLGFSDELMPF